MKVETAIETPCPDATKSDTCAQEKVVQEHADFSARSGGWVVKFQRTKGKRMVNLETTGRVLFPADRGVMG